MQPSQLNLGLTQQGGPPHSGTPLGGMPLDNTLSFQEKLLEWFERQQRSLPWRQSYDAYQVWISEIMLQQTQVTTMLPYFERWMTELPSIETLAQASEDVVLKLWEGLGYYSRARNLRKAAQIICKEHQGIFPQDFKAILDLPGIGRYTAGAIASIAFNQNKPIVDGNVTRVICRIMDLRGDPKTKETKDKLWQFAEEWIPQGAARSFNQGMMELGATVCFAKNPTCLICPAQQFCNAFHQNSIDQVPAKTKRKTFQLITTVLGVIQKQGKILIQKRPSEGLMGGLWEFPNYNLEKAEHGPEAKLEKMLKHKIRKNQNIKISIDQSLPIIKHGYTSFKVHLHCFLCTYQNSQKVSKQGSNTINASEIKKNTKWVTLNELNHYSFPAAHGKVIQQLISFSK